MRDYRGRLRAAGLRPIQIWVPDVRARDFDVRLRAQIAGLNPECEEEALNFIEVAAAQLDDR